MWTGFRCIQPEEANLLGTVAAAAALAAPPAFRPCEDRFSKITIGRPTSERISRAEVWGRTGGKRKYVMTLFPRDYKDFKRAARMLVREEGVTRAEFRQSAERLSSRGGG